MNLILQDFLESLIVLNNFLELIAIFDKLISEMRIHPIFPHKFQKLFDTFLLKRDCQVVGISEVVHVEQDIDFINNQNLVAFRFLSKDL